MYIIIKILLLGEDKLKWRKQELEEEKKSVRFDLDKQLSNIKFNLSDSEEIEVWKNILFYFFYF